MAKPKELFNPEWFPYYFERFEESDRVAVMSLAEEGAYHRAIRIAWKCGSVPSSPHLLAAKIQKRCTPKIAAVVLTMFEPLPDNPARMFHPTVEEIRKEQELKHLVKVRGGKASVKARKQKSSSTTGTEQGSAQAEVSQIKILDLDLDKESDFKRLILRACETHSKIDSRIVEIGILYTMLQRNGVEDPIRSVKYFDPEIKKVAGSSKSLGNVAIDALLHTRRLQFWKSKGWEQST